MARNLSNDFEQAEYGDVPFTPYVAPKKRRNEEDFESYEPIATVPNYFLRSILYGLVGAAIGAVIYAVFVGVTGWSIGYVAILVGFIIGKLMMMGSVDRGGEKYQFVAVVLTYLSVAAAHALVLWYFGEQGRPVPVNMDLVIGLARYGLLFPILHVIASPGYGVIGLIILFVGMRAAWRMTSEFAGERRSPFRR